tara:strand:+ start:107 stop:337 length:231 start_codon:yes stop_codon:yes gene_type:complete
MNIPENIAWLEDFAVHGLELGNANQASRIWQISKWIGEANELLEQQNELLAQLKERTETLYKENEYLQNRLMRFGA